MVFIGFLNTKGVFHNQNERAKRAIISHNALLGGYEGFSLGVLGELFQKTPISL